MTADRVRAATEAFGSVSLRFFAYPSFGCSLDDDDTPFIVAVHPPRTVQHSTAQHSTILALHNYKPAILTSIRGMGL